MNNCRSEVRRSIWLPIIAVVTLLAGCGGGSSSSPTAVPAATLVPTVILAGPLTVGQIVWTTESDPVTNAPMTSVASFESNSVGLIATFPVTNLDVGTIFSAAWSYNQTPMEQLASSVVASERSLSTWVRFALSAPTGTTWPDGRYAISVTINGQTGPQGEVIVG